MDMNRESEKGLDVADEFEFVGLPHDGECPGHPADEFSDMGVTQYCDGSCLNVPLGQWVHPVDAGEKEDDWS